MSHHFLELRQRYLVPSKDDCLCVGPEGECRSFGRLDASWAPWGSIDDEAPRRDFKVLQLLPDPEGLPDARIPAFVSRMEGVRLLTLPHPFISNIRAEALPPHLLTLHIVFDGRFDARFPMRATRWPDVRLEGLRGLHLANYAAPSSAWSRFGLKTSHVPTLDFFMCDITGNEKGLGLVEGLTTLRFLELGGVGNHRIATRLPPDLEVVSLAALGATFDLQAFCNSMHSLKVLQIKGSRAEVDCEVFVDLPELVELNLITCRQLKNVGALLRCVSLRSLRVLDCGSPFSSELKAQFKARPFERLEIDYS